MTNLASVQVIVYGRVQGVFFRVFTLDQARELGLTGFAHNLPDGQAVEVQAEGERNQLENLISIISIGPPTAKVEKVEVNWSEYTGNYPDFTMRY